MQLDKKGVYSVATKRTPQFPHSVVRGVRIKSASTPSKGSLLPSHTLSSPALFLPACTYTTIITPTNPGGLICDVPCISRRSSQPSSWPSRPSSKPPPCLVRKRPTITTATQAALPGAAPTSAVAPTRENAASRRGINVGHVSSAGRAAAPSREESRSRQSRESRVWKRGD